METIIVSRHPATVAWLKGMFFRAPAIEQATEDDVRGKHVVGNIPLHLASLAGKVTAVEFRGQAPRGSEYTLEDMMAAGLHLEEYVVTRTTRCTVPVCRLGWSQLTCPHYEDCKDNPAAPGPQPHDVGFVDVEEDTERRISPPVVQPRRRRDAFGRNL